MRRLDFTSLTQWDRPLRGLLLWVLCEKINNEERSDIHGCFEIIRGVKMCIVVKGKG
jgi:hypothetical protein